MSGACVVSARELRVERGAQPSGFTLAIDALDLFAGEVLPVVGPNGAGKTTLLRALAGLEPACGGFVQHAGGRPVALIFQRPIMLAGSVAFNVRADAAARTALRDQNVQVRYYSIIYEAIDDIRTALTGMLAPEVKEQIVGLAEVRDVFRSSKFGTVAGCLVVDGYVRRNNPIRVLRDNVVIFQGELESLKRFKDDASEVRAGTECGIGVKGYNDVKVGDQIECFERVEVARQL